MSNIPVFLASDDNYAPFVATTIASICDNTKSFVDFYILDSGISQQNQEKINSLSTKFNNFSIEFITIDIEKEFAKFEVTSYLSLATYTRFLIPQLKPNLNKVLYLDVDIIALGDIAELYNQNLNDFALGAIKDQGKADYISMLKNNLDMTEDSTYFNAGILLMDLKKWRQEKIIEKLFEIEEKYRGNLLCNDQDILNKYFENNFKILDKKFNVMVENDEIVVRHYVSKTKPWNIQIQQHYPIVKNVDDFMKYVKIADLDISAYKVPMATLRLKMLRERMSNNG